MEKLWDAHAEEVQPGRHKVDVRNGDARSHPGRCHAGMANDERNPRDFFINSRPLPPEAMATHHFAMVGGVGHEGPRREGVNRFHHPTDLRIRIAVAAEKPGLANDARIRLNPHLPGPFLLTPWLARQIVGRTRCRKIEGLERAHKRLGADERCVGFVDGDDEKEILIPVFFEKSDCAVGAPVRVGEVRGDAVPGDIRRAEHLPGQIPGGIIRQGFEVFPSIEPEVRIPAGRASSIAKIVRAVEVPHARF